MVKPQPLDTLRIFYDPEEGRNIACYVAGMDVLYNFFPPYQPGDILYVRETWRQVATYIYWYKADSCVQNILWHPSIHMPKEAARIFLRVLERTCGAITRDNRRGMCPGGHTARIG